jgi:hypothetical protein
MNGNDYKRVLHRLQPEEGLEERLRQRLSGERGRRHHRRYTLAAVCGVIAVLLIGAFYWGPRDGLSRLADWPGTVASPGAPGYKPAEGTVYVPKIELPKSSANLDMIGLIVYKGRIYTQTASVVDPESAKELRGEHIGRTKGTLNEWSKQEDFARELASSTGAGEVYKVKGYDDDFRILLYQEYEDGVLAELYECLNGIEVKSGADWFGRLKLEGRIVSAAWLDYESWTNGKLDQEKTLQAEKDLDTLIRALDHSVPVEDEKVPALLDRQSFAENLKVLRVTLKDHIVVELRLHKDGYATYGWGGAYFKMEQGALEGLWNKMK